MSKSRKDEQRQLIEAAMDQGWNVVEKARNIQLRSPDGSGIVTVHHTESDHPAAVGARPRPG